MRRDEAVPQRPRTVHNSDELHAAMVALADGKRSVSEEYRLAVEHWVRLRTGADLVAPRRRFTPMS